MYALRRSAAFTPMIPGMERSYPVQQISLFDQTLECARGVNRSFSGCSRRTQSLRFHRLPHLPSSGPNPSLLTQEAKI